MRLNRLGAVLYVVMTVWIVVASTTRLVLEVQQGSIDFLPFAGFAVAGCVILATLWGWARGRVRSGVSAARRPSSWPPDE